MSERGQGGLLCQGVTPRRDRGIDSGERDQAFGRGYGGKLGGHSCHPRKVEAPDALCAPVRKPFGGRPSLPPAPPHLVRARKPGVLGSCIQSVFSPEVHASKL